MKDKVFNQSRPLLPSLGLLIFVAAAPVLAETSTNLPSIFVAPFKSNGGTAIVSWWQPAVGEGLAEMLITELTKLDRFNVVESTSKADLEEEIKLGQDGWVTGDEAVKKGGWDGADFAFIAKVTRFGDSSTSYGGSDGGFGRGLLRLPGGFGITKNKASIQIDWRIVDVPRRRVVKADRAEGEETGTSWSFGSGMGSGFSNTREFRGSALGKATMKAIAALVAQLKVVPLPPPARGEIRQAQAAKQDAEANAKLDAQKKTPGNVVGVAKGGVLVVSLGKNQGLSAGDRLKVYAPEETRNDKGEVIFKEERPAGEIVLTVVQDGSSKGTYAGKESPQTGWSVRKD